MFTLWKFLLITTILIVSITILPKRAAAPIYKIDTVLAKIIQCESGGDQSAIGKMGEIGILQYMPSTWKEWTAKMGKPELDINSKENQIEVYHYAAKNGLLRQWSCFVRLFP